jgi:uncharacterized protein YbjT (DUF2867 family)
VVAALGSAARPASRTSGFDWTSPDTWKPALAGVSSVYVVPPPLQLGVPVLAEFVDLAAGLGVRRLVLLSARGVPETDEVERAVRESGVDWTVLRPVWFSQNFSEDLFLPSILGRSLVLPTGSGVEPFIDADDIADVAVAAMTDSRHAGQVYELSGPDALSFSDAVRLIGEAIGSEVRFVDQPPSDFRSLLESQGVPADDAARVTMLLERVAAGGDAHLSDGVQRALGRAPRTFADYAKATAATGIWG